ncbi:MAG: DNA methylase, partial [Prevotella sp.]|nr:DNA methylase [Prevotella sp.]
MADAAALHLVEKEMLTKQIVLTVGYDISSLTDKNIVYAGEITTDRYGRQVPKHAHGTVNLKEYTASSTQIVEAVARLYDKIVDRNLLVRKIYITTSNVVGENSKYANTPTQTQLFADTDGGSDNMADSIKRKRKERQIQKTQIAIKQRFGKNAILKGLNFGDGATARERNMQIGGHKA